MNQPAHPAASPIAGNGPAAQGDRCNTPLAATPPDLQLEVIGVSIHPKVAPNQPPVFQLCGKLAQRVRHIPRRYFQHLEGGILQLCSAALHLLQLLNDPLAGIRIHSMKAAEPCAYYVHCLVLFHVEQQRFCRIRVRV